MMFYFPVPGLKHSFESQKYGKLTGRKKITVISVIYNVIKNTVVRRKQVKETHSILSSFFFNHNFKLLDLQTKQTLDHKIFY